MAAAVVLTTAGIKAADKFSAPTRTVAGPVAGPDGCPEEMVYVTIAGGGFCLDRYEASAGEKCPAKLPANQDETRQNLDAVDCRPAAIPGQLPWRNISQNQAAIACAKAGKRLASNKEWLQAALGTPDKAAGWTADDCHVAKNWTSGHPGQTGSARQCVSAAGAFDMIGNVWEWVDGTVYEGKFKEKILPDQGFIKSVDEDALANETDKAGGDLNYNQDYFWIKNKGTRGIARGGYWDNQADAGLYAAYVVSLPSFSGDGIGFRCAK